MSKLFPDRIARLQWIAVVFFTVVYSLLSLVNHYNFRTYAYDMGVQNNALWDYAHFSVNSCMLLQPELKNYLSEHFEIFIMILAPFSYIFGTYTLLVFQIFFILCGGWGVYKYISAVSSDPVLSFLAQLHFYFFYGIFSALNYDFHNNVIGAMLLPWFFYFFHNKDWKRIILVFVSILLTKENMPLWLAFVCAGLAILYRADRSLRNAAAVLGGTAFISFLIIVKYIMPALANEGEAYVQIRSNYSAVGASLSEITVTIFTDPARIFNLLFFNHTGNYLGDHYKMETYLFLVLSGGILFLLRPAFLIMIIPIIAQKMFHNDFLKWGIGDHYSIEFAPVCSLGAFFVIASLHDTQWKKYLAYIAAFFSLVMTIRSFDSSYTYFDRDRHRVYQARHYSKNYDVKEAHAALKLIPADAIVSAQSPFVPHLAFRDRIYQFPVIHEAEYVVFSYEEYTYPLTKESFAVQAAMLISSPDWEKIYEKNAMIILKRKSISKE